MRRLFFLLPLLAGCAPGLSVAPFPIQSPLKRHMIVEADNSMVGSGVYLGNDIYLTALHVVANHERHSFVSNETYRSPTRIVWQREDVVVLSSRRRLLPSVEFARPILGQEVVWVHPVMNQDGEIRLFVMSGRISRLEEGSFYIDQVSLPGSSGSGVWNRQGKLVGIVTGVFAFASHPIWSKVQRIGSVEDFLSRR